MLWREWKAYQYAKAHKDDPDSWSQDDALPEQKRPATPAEQVGPEADQKGRDEDMKLEELCAAVQEARYYNERFTRREYTSAFRDLHGAVRTTVHGGRPGDGGGP